MIRVAVLMGGRSSEREISLASGKQILQHLPKGFVGKPYDPAKAMDTLIRDARAKRIQLVFNGLHGGAGENGQIQSILDYHGIRYTGSGVLASALAMDKAMSKAVFKEAGIPVAKSLLIEKKAWQRSSSKVLSLLGSLGSKLVIKPNASGSSVGVFVNPPMKNWKKAIQAALKEDGNACLAEVFQPGREFSVGVLDIQGCTEALPVIEIRPKRAFFDYAAKYKGASEEICPAPISPAMERRMRTLALMAHASLGCRGYSRTDMIWTKRGPIVLETNTLPGMTKMSLLPQEAKVAGISFSELLGHILKAAQYADA